MRKIITLISGLLLSTALMAQHTGQLYNEGKLYVSPNTLMTAKSDFINSEEGVYNNDGEVLLKAGFENQGSANFIRDGGLTRFEGDAIQDISGAEPAYFYDVLFDNNTAPNPFHLSGWINIDGNADFTQGIVDNLNYDGTIDFLNQAIHSNTSDESFVNGKVGWYSDLDFVFPVGKSGYYRPAKISAPKDGNAYFKGEFFFDNSDTYASPHAMKPDGIKQIDDQEYWIIEKKSGGNEEMFVTLSLRDVTTPDFIMQAAQNNLVTIVRWNEEKHLWVNEGGHYDPYTEAVTSNAVSGFGKFTLALLDKDLTLPCNITVYNAVTANGDGHNDYFRIEDHGTCAKDLQVKIFNRWGVKVFESANYGPGDDVFDGFSGGRLTLNENQERLPEGTYFYILEYRYEVGDDGLKTNKQAGYLYLSNQ